MPEAITPIARITAEATAAATSGQPLNDACPYPFDSEAGRLFKHTYIETLHANLQAAIAAKRNNELALMQAAQAAMKDVA